MVAKPLYSLDAAALHAMLDKALRIRMREAARQSVSHILHRRRLHGKTANVMTRACIGMSLKAPQQSTDSEVAASGKQRGKKKSSGGMLWNEDQASLIDCWKGYIYTLSRAKDGKFMENAWMEMHKQIVEGWHRNHLDMGISFRQEDGELIHLGDACLLECGLWQ